MRVSLNKANKIRTILENFVEEKTNSLSSYSSIHLNGYEDGLKTVQAKVDTNIAKTKEHYDLVVNGFNHIFNLRNLIQTTNQEKGINSVIADIAKTNELIKFLSMNFSSEMDVNEFSLKAAVVGNKTAAMNNPSLGFRSLPYPVYASIDALWHNEQHKRIRTLKKQLIALEEKRNELNHQSYVEIPGEIESYLTENDLI